VTGAYGAAYRLVDLVFLPVNSLLIAAYARFFQQGVRGVLATAHLARRLLAVAAGYSLAAAAALYLLAPLVPEVLGAEYREAIEIIRFLAILPVIKAIYYFGADALTGAGYQGVRTIIQVALAAINIGLNLVVIPLYSWKGAALATLVTEALLGLTIWLTIWLLATRERAGARPAATRGVALPGDAVASD
jgi:O-antigen/teichoic acid export membrane protein